LFAFAKIALAQNESVKQKSRFLAKTFEHQGKSLPYRILMPKDFDVTKKYPLHLFLHGSGERGNDNLAQLVHGSTLFEVMNAHYPAIVIFPQCPTEDYWATIEYSRDIETQENVFTYFEESKPTWALSAVMSLLENQLKNEYIDTKRVYLSGLSMGGMGAFELLARLPNTFAAATPICGGGHPASVKKWGANTPVWIFHGDEDTVVNSRYSKIMVEALLRIGVEPEFSLYPKVGHNSWDNAFAEAEFFEWIYNNIKKQN